MKTATIEQLLSWYPCYSEARIRALAGDATAFAALDVLRHEDISAEDRLWVVLRPALIEVELLQEFVCDCAEHAQPPDADPRSLAAIATKRRWLRGEASDEELRAARNAVRDAARNAVRDAAGDAARAAAWDAAWDAAWAAWAAARNAARAAAWAAARDAAWDAAWAAARAARAARAAERQWQLAHLIEMLEATNGPR